AFLAPKARSRRGSARPRKRATPATSRAKRVPRAASEASEHGVGERPPKTHSASRGLRKANGIALKEGMPHKSEELAALGARTLEKIVRIQETAGRLAVPLIYLVDSAGARITDQIDMFPGRRHAGRIFHNEVHLSGAVPQLCLLFGPSAAGGAYIPAFCDVVFMVEKNASMYLGSPRMAEMVIGEKITLEELGGARMHCEV